MHMDISNTLSPQLVSHRERLAGLKADTEASITSIDRVEHCYNALAGGISRFHDQSCQAAVSIRRNDCDRDCCTLQDISPWRHSRCHSGSEALVAHTSAAALRCKRTESQLASE
ncbi:hypothetical protein KIPB_009466 [Kipferlia bialata]|uniref:Uncharacterized protein n=1 Tax=Kipferlia bialata TaxID=797122 RepID=A0A9K3D1S2_9EUKA|nr:hypothetical protein KIPB_009466 [Kipferlia bialata]|eukprot:g9466.t1